LYINKQNSLTRAAVAAIGPTNRPSVQLCNLFQLTFSLKNN